MNKILSLPLVVLLATPVSAQQAEFDYAATPPAPFTSVERADYEPLLLPSAQGVNVTIIESQSANSGHVQDTQWLSLATSEGFTASIAPQSTLTSTAFYATTDILVISSGLIGLPGAAVTNIQGFLAQGGAVYMQGEYLPTYDPNNAFATIVNNDGGSFTVGGTVAGDLQPMAITGVLSNTPYTTGSLTYHWYGCNGSAGTTTPFMSYGGSDFGWMYTMSNGSRIVHNTDQDWVRVATNRNLMANILYWLCDGGSSFTISVSNLVAGQVATLNIAGATPSGSVLSAYSLTGAGPTATPYGNVALSLPIMQLPAQTADGAGNASYSQFLPASAMGVPVWIHAYDSGSGALSNALAEVIG